MRMLRVHVGVGYHVVGSIASNLGSVINSILSNGEDPHAIVVLVKVVEGVLPVVCSGQSCALNLNTVSEQVNSYDISRCTNPLLCYWNRNLPSMVLVTVSLQKKNQSRKWCSEYRLPNGASVTQRCNVAGRQR